MKQREIQSIGFLHKFLQGYQNLKILDLTDNKLGNSGAQEITHLIEETTTVEVLNLSKNGIGPAGLQRICSALTENESIKTLDIRDNAIQDESLKMLLAMLYRNRNIEEIKYSVTNDENVKKLADFRKWSHLDVQEIEDKLELDHTHESLTCR